MASQSLKDEIEAACETNMQLRNMREFFHAYGKASAYCFDECITNFNRRSLSEQEHICIRSCGLKNLTGQQKTMQVFQDVMPKIMERQQLEMEKKMAAEAEKTKAAMEIAMDRVNLQK